MAARKRGWRQKSLGKQKKKGKTSEGLVTKRGSRTRAGKRGEGRKTRQAVILHGGRLRNATSREKKKRKTPILMTLVT